MHHPLRLLQALTLGAAGLFGLFVVIGNLNDSDANFQFVQHVLSMDTTFEDSDIRWRAIDLTAIHIAAFVGIIAVEAAFTALALIGAVLLLRHRRADRRTYDRARAWGFAAYGMGILIWFVGFIVVGSEWFAMWQSDTWNGKETAMGLATLWAVFAVLLAQNEPEPEPT
ncbi:DUF2165 family protein [Leucobacter sp. W1478]|uniref:DUF2165 family protein n=1 Tax=Leucobacter sp. W1478 TaxID=3439065 RepID=UPI003F353E19